MEKSDKLVRRTVREIADSSTTSPTAAGQSEPPAITSEKIDAINQVFALFRLNYHNQYYKAYPTEVELAQIKKLWAESLREYSAEQILRAAKVAMESSEYLPNIHRMLECCREINANLPAPRTAYLEACNAPSPKTAYAWSHPMVYHAGLETGWYLLANEAEKNVLPVFERIYLKLCRRVAAGEEFTIEQTALPEPTATPLSKEENRRRLKALRKTLNL